MEPSNDKVIKAPSDNETGVQFSSQTSLQFKPSRSKQAKIVSLPPSKLTQAIIEDLAACSPAPQPSPDNKKRRRMRSNAETSKATAQVEIVETRKPLTRSGSRINSQSSTSSISRVKSESPVSSSAAGEESKSSGRPVRKLKCTVKGFAPELSTVVGESTSMIDPSIVDKTQQLSSLGGKESPAPTSQPTMLGCSGNVGINQNECQFCFKSFGSPYHLNRHLQTRERLILNGDILPNTCPTRRLPIPDPATGRNTYPCGDASCGQVFRTSIERTNHERTHVVKENDSLSTEGRKKFQCPNPSCGRLLCNKEKLDDHIKKCGIDDKFKSRHSRVPRPVYELNQDEIFECGDCGKTFTTSNGIHFHKIRFHTRFPPLSEMSLSIMQRKNPLKFTNGFAIREEHHKSLDDPNFRPELEWLYKWVLGHMNYMVQKTNDHKYGVYLAGSLGTNFNSSQDVGDFIKDNPESFNPYWGSDTGGSPDISSRHRTWPDMSPLGRAAQLRMQIACLERKNFLGNWLDKETKMREQEALMILMCLIDAEYEPLHGIPQYKFLNKRRELKALAHLTDEFIRPYIQKALKGVQLLCFEKGCDMSCEALVHPDWSKMLLVDMTKVNDEEDETHETDEDGAMDWEKEPGHGDDAPMKLPRLSDEVDIQTEVESRLKQLREEMKKFDPNHYVYTVITPDAREFGADTSAEDICTQILVKKRNDITIPIYTGVNNKEEMAKYESHAVRRQIKSGSIGIVIDVKEFPSRRLARMEECLRLLHSFIQCRFWKKGMKFDPLNQHMEWLHLSLCSEKQIKQAIFWGLLGVLPVILCSPEKIPTLSALFKCSGYPIFLHSQVLKASKY
ncbi:uncharacterized protein LOC118436113 [Folsomia candida]|nr:uncharacterized protein LOC118436113 [Folsomia candida]